MAGTKCVVGANVAVHGCNLFGFAITRGDENLALAWSVMGCGWAIAVALLFLAFRSVR